MDYTNTLRLLGSELHKNLEKFFTDEQCPKCGEETTTLHVDSTASSTDANELLPTKEYFRCMKCLTLYSKKPTVEE